MRSIRILYFARLREQLARDAEELLLPPEANSVADLIDILRTRGGIWAQALGQEQAYRVAVNQAMAKTETAIPANAEVAIFPPVTGG